MPETRKPIERVASQHEAEQYEAGYGARFRDEAFCEGATRNWQAGWSDANRELGNFEEAMQPERKLLSAFRVLWCPSVCGEGEPWQDGCGMLPVPGDRGTHLCCGVVEHEQRDGAISVVKRHSF